MMSKIRLPAAALLLLLSVGVAPLTASAPLSALAASSKKVATPAVNTKTSIIKVNTVDVKMVFDGVTLVPPSGQVVFIYNNTTYVPLRFMSYALQKTVAWDAKNLKVTVNEPNSSELVVIKEYLMNAMNNQSAPASKALTLNDVKAKFVFNGNAKNLPASQSSYILNGTLYVPLRFLSESVGNQIKWDQKTKTITATSASYQGQNESNTTGSSSPSAIATPAPVKGATAEGGTSGTGTITYEQITSTTEAKLTALRSQSTSTLMSLALEYFNATDDAAKASIVARGKQQLASFTANFNDIIADAEKQLTANGYNTDIINQYRATFEAELQKGVQIAEGMGS